MTVRVPAGGGRAHGPGNYGEAVLATVPTVTTNVADDGSVKRP